jgi:hypothetical protein
MKFESQSRPVSRLGRETYMYRPDRPVFSGADIFPTEDEKEFSEFRVKVFSELSPEDSWQEEIVIRISKLRWRLLHPDIFLKAAEARKLYGGCLRDSWFDTRVVHMMYERRRSLKDMLAGMKRKIANLRGEVLESERPAVVHPAPRLLEELKALTAQINQCASEIEDLGKKHQPAASGDRSQKLHDLADAINGVFARLDAAPSDPQSFNSILEEEIDVLSESMERAFGRSEVEEMLAEAEEERRVGTDLELAFLADAITAEGYAEELKLAEAIEKELARLLCQLQDLKKYKRQEQARESRGSWLLPPYGLARGWSP